MMAPHIRNGLVFIGLSMLGGVTLFVAANWPSSSDDAQAYQSQQPRNDGVGASGDRDDAAAASMAEIDGEELVEADTAILAVPAYEACEGSWISAGDETIVVAIGFDVYEGPQISYDGGEEHRFTTRLEASDGRLTFEDYDSGPTLTIACDAEEGRATIYGVEGEPLWDLYSMPSGQIG